MHRRFCLLKRAAQPGCRSGRACRRLVMEPLEGRCLLSVMPVDVAVDGFDQSAIRTALMQSVPTAYEQYMLELINRARSDPAAEAARNGIDLNEGLPAGTISTAAKQPLAFNPYLIESTQLHSQWMLDTDTFSHTGSGDTDPGDRMENAGYSFTPPWSWGENIAWQGTTGAPDVYSYVAELEDDLFVDASTAGRGHRLNLMNSSFRELGVGVRTGVYGAYNAVMITQDFAYAGSSLFLTGVVYDDDLVLANSFYTPGEGLGGVAISATRQSDQAVFTTTTWDSGGYTLALPAGTYDVTASGTPLGGTCRQDNVTIGSQNVKIDFSPDDAVATLSLSVSPGTFPENAGVAAAVATVTRSGSTAAALTVSLTSSDMTEATVQSTVTIPAGQASTTFNVSAVDDDVADGTQTVSIAASADGYVGDSTTVNVADAGGPVLLPGTAGDDRLKFFAGSTCWAVLNDVLYAYDPGETHEVVFDAGLGNDTITLIGTSNDETVDLGNGFGRFHAQGLLFTATGAESITAKTGGGHDTVNFTGSPSDDVLTVSPILATLVAPGINHWAEGFSEVFASAMDDGTDSAKLIDSVNDDTFTVWPTYSTMSGSGFECRVESFEVVRAYASDGTDRAEFHDSDDSDTFTVTPQSAILSGAGLFNQAKFFDEVHAYATAGGTDTAKLLDSSSEVTFTAWPTYSTMSCAGFLCRVESFEAVCAYGMDANDTAEFHDSAADEKFSGTPESAILYNTAFYNRAKFFATVQAYATEGGNDTAKFFDSTGDDEFYATPAYATLTDNYYYTLQVEGFDAVQAYASEGYDAAILEDSTGDDTFYATPAYGALYNTGFYNRAVSFDEVCAHAYEGGSDTARIYGTEEDDYFWGLSDIASLVGDNFYHETQYFDYVYAYGNGGYNIAEFYDSMEDDTFIGTPTSSTLWADGYYFLRAKDFQETYVYADQDGYDVAELYDSLGPDYLEADEIWACMSGADPSYVNWVADFQLVTAYGRGTGDTKTVAQAVDFLVIEGVWEDV